MALTGTLQNGLERYGMGPNVRDLRTRKRTGLVELCAHGSLGGTAREDRASRMYPTLPTLLP